ncbi:MAG: phosphoadenylyl-sulfate reductase [Oceanicaulis sp.]|nr:phosphoadenylyl-sulfate reductase [Oceanicaulis sp.]
MGSEAVLRDVHARIEIDTATAPETALEAGRRAGAIDVRFPGFKDGRGYSLAALIRESGYAGELRAVGDILPDQKDCLERSGFDAISPDTPSPRWQRAGFTHAYQLGIARGATDRPPVYRARALAARKEQVDALNREHSASPPQTIIAASVDAFSGRIAMLSSFGVEAALGLALLAQVDRRVPVLFLDTQRHFPQTLTYRDQLIAHLGLEDVRILTPDPAEARALDSDGKLYERDSETCCELRKVRPLGAGLEDFDAVITGRKRAHGGERQSLQPFEFDGERVMINPVAGIDPAGIAALYRQMNLPAHPLREQGYASVGCWPCTAPSAGLHARDGRWPGSDRSECGIFDQARTDRAVAARKRAVRLIG